MSVRQPKPCVIDFETFAIRGRPNYPPPPVGVSIKYPGKPSRYYAFGHPTGNNSTYTEARAALAKAYEHEDGLLFHHSKFDIDVAEVFMGLPVPDWTRIHDTVFLLFLDNPHSRSLGLKEAAEKQLSMPPEERDAVADWLIKNQPVPGVKISAGKGSKHPAGAYIAYAPGDIVGSYANGDTDRTEKLFRHLWKSVVLKRKMGGAYDRERHLSPILLRAERDGVRIDVERLTRDVANYRSWMHRIDKYIRARLRLSDLNIDSGQGLAHGLIGVGLASRKSLGVTPGGAIATNKAAISGGVTDPVMAGIIQYRSQLKTCLSTFMEPWLEVASQSGGLIFTNWNQTKSDKETGTKTGRLSSTPNFQNIPKEFQAIFAHEADREEDPARAARIRKIPCPWPDLPALPLCRSYIVPYAKGHVLVGRDYSQQEPRILAHYEDGSLKQQYLNNVWIDYHDNAKEHLERVMDRPYKRKPVKNINLGIIYGQGVPSLAVKNESSVAETQEIKDAIYKLYPGLKEMYTDMKNRAAANEPIRTWGGREVYCEPSFWLNGRLIKLDYKMLNYLIQGSAADCTKEAVIRLFILYGKRMHNRGWKFLLQVHDEIVLSVPIEDMAEAQEALRVVMESVEFDVPILSEGAWSTDNWASMIDYDKKGKIVWLPNLISLVQSETTRKIETPKISTLPRSSQLKPSSTSKSSEVKSGSRRVVTVL